tara:strand:+ start:480 stop:722 length:243 start_codon:yes stop_codon:yes gene_type:complete
MTCSKDARRGPIPPAVFLEEGPIDGLDEAADLWAQARTEAQRLNNSGEHEKARGLLAELVARIKAAADAVADLIETGGQS